MHGRSRFPVKIGKQWEHIDVGSNHPLGQQADTERYQQQEKESRSERSLANGHNKLRLGACRAGDYGGSDKTRVGSTSSLQWMRNPGKPSHRPFFTATSSPVLINVNGPWMVRPLALTLADLWEDNWEQIFLRPFFLRPLPA